MTQNDNNSANTSNAAFPMLGFAQMNSFANALMRANLEMMGMASKRMRAQLELAKEVATCRTAEDVSRVGADFWHEAFSDYATCNQRLMGVVTQGVALPAPSEAIKSAASYTRRIMDPVVKATEDAGEQMIEHPTEPWAWWRTDMKGLKSTRSPGQRDVDERRVAH